MALDIGIAAVKAAMKAFTAYNEKKEELLSFERDYDKLNLRVQALKGLIEVVEGNLDPKLNWFVYPAKQQLIEAANYTESLLKFCNEHKAQAPKFLEIAGLLMISAAEAIPKGPLKNAAIALATVCGSRGVPAKAYADFSEDITWLITTIGAMAAASSVSKANTPAVQRLNQERMSVYRIISMREDIVDNNEAQVDNPVATITSPVPEISKYQSVEGLDLNAPVQVDPERMAKILDDSIQCDPSTHRFIFLEKFSSALAWHYALAVWVDKVPFLIQIDQDSNYSPACFWICACPSNEYLSEVVNSVFAESDSAKKKALLLDIKQKLPSKLKDAILANSQHFDGIPNDVIARNNDVLESPIFVPCCLLTCGFSAFCYGICAGMFADSCDLPILSFTLKLKEEKYLFEVGHFGTKISENEFRLRFNGADVTEFDASRPVDSNNIVR